MAKASKPKGFDNLKDPEQYLVTDPGGATHQAAEGAVSWAPDLGPLAKV